MYAYRIISAPDTVEAARERVTELADMFVFTTYVVAEVQMPDGLDTVNIVAVDETPDGDHRTISAAKGAYIEWCQGYGRKVRSIDECHRV